MKDRPSKGLNSPRQPWQQWLLLIGLLTLFLALRLPGLGRFVTTDEALWLRRSANFYLAVSNQDWGDTFQSEHPGMVAQWAGAAAFAWIFPQYAQVGEPAVHDGELLRLMENRGVNPMEVLAAARFVLVLVHGAAFLACWPYARRLLGTRAAALGLGLIALDPFTIAHQRLLHQDGLLASFMLLSVLAYADHLREGRSSSLIVSGVAAGLAWLTKTPSWFLLPFMLGLTLWTGWKEKKKSVRQISLWLVPLVWGLVGLLILFLLFPAMWAAPVDVLGQMGRYALGTAEGEYSGPVFFNGQVYPDGNLGGVGWIFYPLSYLWRSTPLTVLGWLLAAWAILRAGKKERGPAIANVAVISAFAILFVVFMNLGEKKFDRYMLPAIPALLLVAGWGFAQFAERVKFFRKPRWRGTALLAIVLALQLASAAPTFPYYLSYYNPLLGGSRKAPEVMMIGWGEGLDQAASYLKGQPGASGEEMAAWYSTSFNLLFNAEAGDIPVELQLGAEELETLLAKEYLVIYLHQWQRGTPQNLLDELEGLEPEYVVRINGLEYVRVYHLGGDGE